MYLTLTATTRSQEPFNLGLMAARDLSVINTDHQIDIP